MLMAVVSMAVQNIFKEGYGSCQSNSGFRPERNTLV